MSEVLQKYLPEHAVHHCFELIKANHVHLKIVNERQTRHGDYRKDAQGYHLITVNASLNKYRFLITLIHEIAHLVAFEKYGRNIKPHGDEWKLTFQRMMVPFIRPEIFPNQLYQDSFDVNLIISIFGILFVFSFIIFITHLILGFFIKIKNIVTQ